MVTKFSIVSQDAEGHIDIDFQGDEINLTNNIISAMVASSDIARVIIQAASYYTTELLSEEKNR